MRRSLEGDLRNKRELIKTNIMSLLRASDLRSGIPAIYIVSKDTVKWSRK